MKVPRQWFNFKNAADDPTVAEIQIIDWIGDWIDDAINRMWNEQIGITARAFVEQLAALPASVKTIKVHINSPGGDVQGGINIANALREQASKGRTVETFVDGLAASIASVIAMAGSKVHMSDNALMMVHNPWTVGIGNAAEMRKTADILDTIRGQIVNTYKWHATIEDAEIIALMDAETWMNADEALANGFVTDKVEGLQAAALLDAKSAASLKVPEKHRARVDALLKKETPAPKAAAALDVVRACNEAGCHELATALLESNATAEQVTAKVAEAKAAKATAKSRADAITALCTTHKMPTARAARYIASAMSVDDVRADLTEVTALVDGKVVIDGSLTPGNGAAAKKLMTTAEVYASRNRPTSKE